MSQLENENKDKQSDDTTLRSEIFTLLFPLRKMWNANKILNARIKKIETEEKDLIYFSAYYKLTLDEAKEYLQKTFDARKSIEEKAKTNVLGVTISVTLIVGLSQVFYNDFPDTLFLQIITIFLAIYALASMILATILSLLILGKFNRVYDLYPVNVKDFCNNRIKKIAVNTELNVFNNIKRNNLLYSSYGLIINFLIGLLLLFIVVTLPKMSSTKTTLSELKESQESIYQEVKKLKSIEDKQNQLINEVNSISKTQNSQKELLKNLNKIKQLQDTQNQILYKLEKINKAKTKE